MAKKRQKGKLSEEMANITADIKKTDLNKKEMERNKKEIEIEKKVQSLREQKIKNISEQIKKTAENGNSYIHISALWSDSIEMSLLSIVRNWAKKQGFKLDSSYNEIYESPRSSDDLPSDTRSFLKISWE